MSALPDGFLFGTATSSHQVEGGNAQNDWWAWEQRPGAIADGGASGDAAGWWDGKAEEDLARAAELGQNAHRMSLEWSRLEPEPGRAGVLVGDHVDLVDEAGEHVVVVAQDRRPRSRGDRREVT